MNKKILPYILAGIAVCLVAGGMLLGYYLSIPRPKPGEKTVKIEIIYADRRFDYDNLFTDKGTLYELLMQFDEKYDLRPVVEGTGDFAYLTSLKGCSQNFLSGCYYMFYVNGVEGPEGINTTIIEDGAVYTFKYLDTSAFPTMTLAEYKED